MPDKRTAKNVILGLRTRTADHKTRVVMAAQNSSLQNSIGINGSQRKMSDDGGKDKDESL